MAEEGVVEYDVVVVGAGFAGLNALYSMRGIGCSVHVFEMGDGVGGAWHWNRYPGCRCDVPSLDYSFAFSEELQQEWEWTEKYPTQTEMNAYFNHVADRFDMRKDISLSTRVVAAHYDEGDRMWEVTTDDGRVCRARYLLMGSGCVSIRKDPRIEFEGIEDFKGDWYATSDYPSEGVDYSGKRVIVIGTGSTGIQLIPVVAAQAAHLTVLQRRPAFSIPARNAPMDPEYQAAIKADYAGRRARGRVAPFGQDVPLPDRSALEATPEEVAANLEARWEAGGLAEIMTCYTDILLDERANKLVADFIHDRIRQTVKDPATAELLCATDYPFGTKRPCADTDYYETFNRDNVDLVSVLNNPIQRITENGIRLQDGTEVEADTIVFATGFDAITGALLNIDFRGRDGLLLRDEWAHGPSAYLGLSAAGFPNMFMITGPGSVAVLANNVVTIEQHVDWIADLIVYMRERGLDTAEADREAQQKWMEHVAEVANYTLFPRGNSWYMGSNVEGKPKGLMLYVGGLGAYRAICDEVAAKGYEGLELTGEQVLVSS